MEGEGEQERGDRDFACVCLVDECVREEGHELMGVRGGGRMGGFVRAVRKGEEGSGV